MNAFCAALHSAMLRGTSKTVISFKKVLTYFMIWLNFHQQSFRVHHLLDTKTKYFRQSNAKATNQTLHDTKFTSDFLIEYARWYAQRIW